MQDEILNLVFSQKHIPQMTNTLRWNIIRFKKYTQLLNITDIAEEKRKKPTTFITYCIVT